MKHKGEVKNECLSELSKNRGGLMGFMMERIEWFWRGQNLEAAWREHAGNFSVGQAAKPTVTARVGWM